MKQNREGFLERVFDDLKLGDSSLKVVEMGVGAGKFTLHLHERFPHYQIIGIDRDVSYIDDRLKKAGISDIELRVEDIRSTSLEDGSVDIVFFYNMTRHLSDQSLTAAFSEAARVLATDGKVIVIDRHPSPATERQESLVQIYGLENEIDRLLGHEPEVFRVPGELEPFLRAAGLSVTRSKIFADTTTVLPEGQWQKWKQDLLALCERLPRKQDSEDYRELLNRLEAKVSVTGLETLPSYMVEARFQVRDNVID